MAQNAHTQTHSFLTSFILSLFPRCTTSQTLRCVWMSWSPAWRPSCPTQTVASGLTSEQWRTATWVISFYLIKFECVAGWHSITCLTELLFKKKTSMLWLCGCLRRLLEWSLCESKTKHNNNKKQNRTNKEKKLQMFYFCCSKQRIGNKSVLPPAGCWWHCAIQSEWVPQVPKEKWKQMKLKG